MIRSVQAMTGFYDNLNRNKAQYVNQGQHFSVSIVSRRQVPATALRHSTSSMSETTRTTADESEVVGQMSTTLRLSSRVRIMKSWLFRQGQAYLRPVTLLGQSQRLWFFSTYVPPLFLCLLCVYWCAWPSSILLDAIFIVTLACTLSVILFNIQDKLLYYPNQPEDSRHNVMSPAKFDIPFENITIVTDDGTQLHAFLLKHTESQSKPTMIMYHGNAGNIGHRIPNANHIFVDCQMNVLLLEYRGYGRSGGSISEKGLYDDALSAVKFVQNHQKLDPHRIVLHGRSLGGAVAIYVASQLSSADIYAVILENTFTSLPNIAKCVLSIAPVKMIPIWCYKNKYPSLDRIAHVRQPTLFLSGRADTLVPPKMMDRLHEASGSLRKEMSSFPRGTHNETWMEPGYLFAIKDFISKLS